MGETLVAPHHAAHGKPLSRRTILAQEVDVRAAVPLAQGFGKPYRPQLKADTVGWVEMIAGIGLTIALGRSARERLLGLALLPLVVLAVVIAYEIIDQVIALR